MFKGFNRRHLKKDPRTRRVSPLVEAGIFLFAFIGLMLMSWSVQQELKHLETIVDALDREATVQYDFNKKAAKAIRDIRETLNESAQDVRFCETGTN